MTSNYMIAGKYHLNEDGLPFTIYADLKKHFARNNDIKSCDMVIKQNKNIDVVCWKNMKTGYTPSYYHNKQYKYIPLPLDFSLQDIDKAVGQFQMPGSC